MFWICHGPFCTVMWSFVMSGLVNLLTYSDTLISCIGIAGIISVDTFFFLSGFLLAYGLLKQNKNRCLVAAIACVRRFIRTTVPLFFLAMCFYLLPLIANGPSSPAMYEKFYYDMQNYWWALLLTESRNFQARNLRTESLDICGTYPLTFSLFVISVIVLQLFKGKPKTTIGIFIGLSLASCSYNAWQMHGTTYMPYNLPVPATVQDFMDTIEQRVRTSHYTCGLLLFGLHHVASGGHAQITRSFKGTAGRFLVCISGSWFDLRVHEAQLEPCRTTLGRVGENHVRIFGQDHVVGILELDHVRLRNGQRRAAVRLFVMGGICTIQQAHLWHLPDSFSFLLRSSPHLQGAYELERFPQCDGFFCGVRVGQHPRILYVHHVRSTNKPS
uniref:Putative acyltransferase n=1 Tax=Ixodes ricinus TaxID=34613 RepID=A0A090X8J8_IXORI